MLMKFVVRRVSDFPFLFKMSEGCHNFLIYEDLFVYFCPVKHQFEGLFSQLHKA